MSRIIYKQEQLCTSYRAMNVGPCNGQKVKIWPEWDWGSHTEQTAWIFNKYSLDADWNR